MILSAQTIRNLCVDENSMITPFIGRGVDGPSGKSYGLSSAGYDVRLHRFLVHGQLEDSVRMQFGDFILASSLERIKMPKDVLCYVKDKSSYAREGLFVQNTVLEPGWEGHITFELTFNRPAHHIVLKQGMPIAQLIFHRLDEETEQPYGGKYQNQIDQPVESIKENVK